MRKKNFKGRCEKRVLGKCVEVCRTYDAIQYAYADLLQASDKIKEIRCNVLLDGLEVGEYTSDFVCTKADGDLMVRECVYCQRQSEIVRKRRRNFVVFRRGVTRIRYCLAQKECSRFAVSGA